MRNFYIVRDEYLLILIWLERKSKMRLIGWQDLTREYRMPPLIYESTHQMVIILCYIRFNSSYIDDIKIIYLKGTVLITIPYIRPLEGVNRDTRYWPILGIDIQYWVLKIDMGILKYWYLIQEFGKIRYLILTIWNFDILIGGSSS